MPETSCSILAGAVQAEQYAHLAQHEGRPLLSPPSYERETIEGVPALELRAAWAYECQGSTHLHEEQFLQEFVTSFLVRLYELQPEQESVHAS